MPEGHDELNWLGIKVSKNTVGMLLKEMKYSLRANSKKNSNGEKKLSAKEKKDRDKQFIYINNLRNAFTTGNNAVISVDTKKKELIGNFKNPGKVWGNKEERVNDHDLASYAIGKAIPYSIYNTNLNRGTVFVGTTYDTPNFAVDCIEKWWLKEGYILNPTSKKVLILADGGGSNSSKSRVSEIYKLIFPHSNYLIFKIKNWSTINIFQCFLVDSLRLIHPTNYQLLYKIVGWIKERIDESTKVNNIKQLFSL